MESMRRLEGVLKDTAGYAAAWKAANPGKKIFGHFCTYTPEEIVHAAGIHPMRLFGSKGAIKHADAFLQAYSCSLVRGALEEALSGGLKFLDGAVFPHTCDSIQRLSDIWRLNAPFEFHADVVLPVKLDEPSSRQYMVDVLRKFKNDLEKRLSLSISESSLRESIALFNRIRAAIKRIYEIRSEHPEIMRGEDVFTIVKASMVMDRAELLPLLESVASDLEKKKEKTGPSKKKRLVLSGGICDHPSIYSLIEKSGGTIVWDDLCSGSRYFEGAIAQSGDPIEAIAKRYTERIICPAKHYSLTARGENIVRIAKEHRAQGVVFLFLKFCDPHSFDYPYMKGFLDKEKIPSMLLEIEQELPSEGQLSTRFEAFIEML